MIRSRISLCSALTCFWEVEHKERERWGHFLDSVLSDSLIDLMHAAKGRQREVNKALVACVHNYMTMKRGEWVG